MVHIIDSTIKTLAAVVIEMSATFTLKSTFSIQSVS